MVIGTAAQFMTGSKLPTRAAARATAARRKQLAAARLPVTSCDTEATNAAAIRACDDGNADFERAQLIVSEKNHLRSISSGHDVELNGEIALSEAEIAQCQLIEDVASDEAKKTEDRVADGADEHTWNWFAVLRGAVYFVGAVILSVATLRVGSTFLGMNGEGQSGLDQASMIAFLVLTPIAITTFYGSLCGYGPPGTAAKRFWTGLNIITWPGVAAFIVLLVVSTSTPTKATGSGGRWSSAPTTTTDSTVDWKKARKITQLGCDMLVASIFEIAFFRLVLTHSPQKTRVQEKHKVARRTVKKAAEIRRILEPAHVQLQAARAKTVSWAGRSCDEVENAFTKRVTVLSNIRDVTQNVYAHEGGLFDQNI